MSAAEDFASGKGHKDENFPVASFLIEPRHRPLILAFYRFARAADDVSDNACASESDKLTVLGQMRATLAGEDDADAEALALRQALAPRGITPQHGLDLLEAFRRDVTQARYRDWDELMDYCRYSAAPVGRFVLDVHGEPRTTWAANDALCAALQVINHLQDCAKDRRELDRVYVPLADLRAAGLGVEALDAPAASPALLGVLHGLARRTAELLVRARPLAAQVSNRRLRLEIAFIQSVAEDLVRRLTARDPLSERVHHRKGELVGPAATALFRTLATPRSTAAATAAKAKAVP